MCACIEVGGNELAKLKAEGWTGDKLETQGKKFAWDRQGSQKTNGARGSN